MQVGILGPLEVTLDGAAVEIRRGIPRLLLTALALRPGETVSSDTLVELLWGDDQPRHPANALQIQVSYLRKALAGAERGTPAIVTRPGGYALAVEPASIDARRFEAGVRDASRQAARGTRSDLEGAAATLDVALGLWRGEALADAAGEPFARGETTRLAELRHEAVELRNDVLLALGRHRELVGELARLTRDDPLRERFHAQLMVALYRSGRQADALRAYDDARAVLVEELGLEPGPELQRLQSAVLDQDPGLDWSPPPGPDQAPAGAPGPARAPEAPAPSGRRLVASLPVPLTPLIAREVETDRIRELLARNRIVTLTGPAGTGKTRLAVEVAHLEQAGGEVVYVDLGDLGDPQRVATTVAATLGLPVTPADDAGDLVARWLADHPALLVLDTCEHVLAGAALLVAQVLRLSAATRVLATSRRPLGLTGEIAWPVPPLALAPPTASGAAEVAAYPAASLFCERAAAVRSGFTLTDANAADVAAICLALDGLPLAIELAAARADALTPAAIRARLEDRFALLVGTDAGVAARQQTLRGAIDWSYGLLEDDQRGMLARLSVFPGSFDLDAAVAVAGAGLDDPVSTLSALVRHSVVALAGDDRYRLLESLRVYASERLDEQSSDAAAHRHAEHYASLAETAAPHVRGPEQVGWLARVRVDLPNFQAAVAWSFGAGEGELAARIAGALGWFWTLEGMLDEAVAVFEEAAAVEDAPALVRAGILSGFGLLVASLGDLRRALDLGRQGAELARSAADPSALGNALNTLAVAQWSLGHLEAAAASHDEAVACFDEAGDLWGRGVCLALRARTALDREEPDAETRARAAVPAARACGDRHVIGLALEQVVRTELAAGRLPEAAARAEECLAVHESIGYTEGMVAALHVLGRTRLAAGDPGAAGALHLRALALADGIGHPAATLEAIEDLARVAVAGHDPARAVRLLAVAERERAVRGISCRAGGFEGVEGVRGAARAALGDDAVAVEQEMDAVTLDGVVRQLLA